MAILITRGNPATINATQALVNDLDLQLHNTGTNLAWKPWVLNKFPHIDSLKQLATRKKGRVNNVEQVTLDNPVEGNYQVSVMGYAVTTSPQTFYKPQYSRQSAQQHGRLLILQWTCQKDTTTGIRLLLLVLQY